MRFRLEKKTTKKAKKRDFSNILGGLTAIERTAIERHYLQFDGLVDYAVADAVFGGISGDYTIAIKVASRNTSGTPNFETLFAAGSDTGHSNGKLLRDTAYGKATITFAGANEAGSVVYSVAPGSVGDVNERVVAVKRLVAGGGSAQVRVVKASGVEITGSDATAVLEIPHALAVGTRVNGDTLAPGSYYGDVKFIGLVLASVEVPDAELTAWLNDDTAIGNITGIDHYWCASDINGTEIPARIGTVALSLSGPTSSDLVAWAP